MKKQNEKFKFSPFIPYDPDLRTLYGTRTTVPHKMGVQPYEFSGWREECLSWHETCYIHSGLNPHTTFQFTGPDAINLLSDSCVNSFANCSTGTAKHAIICNKDGLVMQDGVAVRLGEEKFITYELGYLAYLLEKGNYNAQAENLSRKEFNFQLAGPRSLEIVEKVTGEDLHDIKFAHSRGSQINGMQVRVLRIGMAGTLAYEVHGKFEDSIPIYNELLKAGEPYGLRKLGMHAYNITHTEGGFPQWTLDFPSPWAKDKDYMNYLVKQGIPANGPASAKFGNEYSRWTGSMGSNIEARYRNPVELGWGRMIKFDHDFIGREALEKIVKDPKRKMVTLVWNKEDILDVHKSQFESGEPYLNMDDPYGSSLIGQYEYHADKVMKDGEFVGITTGRSHSWFYREMISLCSIDVGCSDIGTEVKVIWGNPDCRQKEIRAKVAGFPYLNENRNENVDVSDIPHPWDSDL